MNLSEGNRHKLIIEEATSDSYCYLSGSGDRDLFLSAKFNELNRKKVEKVDYLVFKGQDRIYGGIAAGVKGDMMLSPFSAPYGGILPDRQLSRTEVESIGIIFADYLSDRGKVCRVTFPAPVIDDSITSANINLIQSLWNNGFHTEYDDLNYHINLDKIKFGNDILRRHKIGRKHGYVFSCSRFNQVSFSAIYNAIERNHNELGYGMSMSSEDFINTSKVAEIYQSGVCYEDRIVAGAICYRTRKEVVQLITWGDDVSLRSTYPAMPFLASELIFWLCENVKDIRVLDLGPASKEGVVNRGLARFKESIGGIPTWKKTLMFRMDLQDG